MMEIPEDWQPDEHQIYLNLKDACEEAYRKREKYKHLGPRFVIISGIVFLLLMFTQDAKVEFLTLWVITVFYTVALMIRVEYKLYKLRKLLGMPDIDGDETEEEEDLPEPEGGEAN